MHTVDDTERFIIAVASNCTTDEEIKLWMDENRDLDKSFIWDFVRYLAKKHDFDITVIENVDSVDITTRYFTVSAVKEEDGWAVTMEFSGERAIESLENIQDIAAVTIASYVSELLSQKIGRMNVDMELVIGATYDLATFNTQAFMADFPQEDWPTILYDCYMFARKMTI